MNERKVLKVDGGDKNGVQAINSVPNVDGEQIPEVPDIESEDDNVPNGGENKFDTNFDAGVEADEESDPKKYIQQLTGKLSQSLRDYNSSLGTPDSDLNKYVAGMIIKQAAKGMDKEDKRGIIDKINNEDEEKSDNNSLPDLPNEGEDLNTDN